MATYLTSNTGTATNAKKFTYSVWLKRSAIDTSASQRFYQGYKDGNNRFYAYFVEGADSNEDRLWIYAVTGGTVEMYWVSNRRFRDTNAWYHIVFSADSTQASQDDRFKVYVNGVEETSWTKNNNPSQNIDWGNQLAQTNNDLTISGTESQTQPFIGLMSHINFIDGTAYDASAFGETDSTTGEWKIKTSPSVTYGNNGFFILKDGNSVTDQSGNGNNFTVGGGTLTKTEDCPDNVFATANPLVGASSSVTYSNGNLTVAIASSKSTPSTLGAGTGKFYFETKLNNTTNTYIGICSDRNTGTDFGNYRPLTESALVNNSGTIYTAGGSSGAKGLTGLADNDIIGCAFDVDNGKVWWSRNGQWYSGDANPTSTINISDVVAGNNAYSFSSWTGQFILGAFGTSSNANNISINFGNGYFGTTAVSSAGTNASGNGIFEYDVPTGYTALSTKGLNL